jgi:hypothetical protein
LSTTDESIELFSIDNNDNDRWYLQAESFNLGSNLDLDMKPSERLSVYQSDVGITAALEEPVQSFASEYIAPGVVDLGGTWNFSIYA